LLPKKGRKEKGRQSSPFEAKEKQFYYLIRGCFF